MIAGTEAPLEEQGGPSGEHEASRLPLRAGRSFPSLSGGKDWKSCCKTPFL